MGIKVPEVTFIAGRVAEYLGTVIGEAGSGDQLFKCPFSTKRAPKITLHKYLNRLAVHSRVSSETFIIAVVYINRILALRKQLTLNSLNALKLIFIALVIASK